MFGSLNGLFMGGDWNAPNSGAVTGKRDERFARLLITAFGGGLLATSIGRLFETTILGYGLIGVELGFAVAGFAIVYGLMRSHTFRD